MYFISTENGINFRAALYYYLPYRNKPFAVSNDKVLRHSQRLLGKRNAKRRTEHTIGISRKRWDGTPNAIHPSHQAFLDLAQQRDLVQMTCKEIAAALGLTGPSAVSYVSNTLKRLRERGLLDSQPRRAQPRYKDKLIAYATTHDISQMHLQDLA